MNVEFGINNAFLKYFKDDNFCLSAARHRLFSLFILSNVGGPMTVTPLGIFYHFLPTSAIPLL